MATLMWEPEYAKRLTEGVRRHWADKTCMDVSIFVGGQWLKANSLVLSSFSPMFQAALAAQREGPVVVLPGVSHHTMSQLLRYLSTGEVMVSQQDEQLVRDLGRMLQVTGLCDEEEEEEDDEEAVVVMQRRKRQRSRGLDVSPGPSGCSVECTIEQQGGASRPQPQPTVQSV